jgi:hypothetical protein
MRIEPYANFGTGEVWVSRVMLGLLAVVDATTVPNRDEVKEAIGAVFEALTAAFNDLRTLRDLVSRGDTPATEITAAYSGFYVHLWRAYKDRFQNSVPPVLGYDIGFLWGSDKTFESGATAFAAAHPEVDAGLLEMMRTDRRKWQNDLALFRNEHLEHQRPVDRELLARFYRSDSAETAFENVWHAIEDITVQLLVPYLPPGIALVEIPEDERDPVVPRRFGFHVPGLDAAGG